VADFASHVDFPVRLTTHRHETFQLARCRNEGALVSTAPYLLFVDGDCILPPDHLRLHLRRRRRGVVVAGDCFRLDKATSGQIDEAAVREGRYLNWVPQSERARLRKYHRQTVFYSVWPHPRKPKLIGNNIGIWREDYERINGYDEEFEGWGCEDDDLARRLRRAGLRIVSIMNWTHAYHMWHPEDTTCPATWRQGANVQRLLDSRRPVFCRKGLVHTEMSVRGNEANARLAGADGSPLSRRPFLCWSYSCTPPAMETGTEKDVSQRRAA
jgi:GT2 family glycosyltransferase